MEFNAFTFSNDDFKLNPLYQYASKHFENNKNFTDVSIHIAKHLYEIALHPQIKSGDLFVASFSNIIMGDILVKGIGIFKSENRQPFLKVNRNSEELMLNYDDGINIDKLDKGCVILNIDKDSGYRVCMVDKSNRSSEAQYWKENFLNLKPCADEYHYTKDFLTLTKNFVTKQITNEFEVNKADQIDLLNKSVEYFKKNEKFNKTEFENEVFQDDNVIKSFRNYNDIFQQENDTEIKNSFDISNQAVKKQSRVFKSVLKLDKNFHIYIHGDRQLIEQGIDSDGRNFYKIYYKEKL